MSPVNGWASCCSGEESDTVLVDAMALRRLGGRDHADILLREKRID